MVSAGQPSGAGLLLQTLEGPIRHALLDWALESGVFDFCETPVTPYLLGQRMKLPAGPLMLALRALAAAGFMEAHEAGFRTAPGILPFVQTGSPHNMVETLRMMARTRHTGLGQLGALVAGGAFASGAKLFDDAHWDAHHRSLAGFHRAIATDTAAPCLTGLPEWSHARSLLDIGPGSSALASRLLALRPDLRITLFDLPPVAERIRDEAANLPITIMSGNYNQTLPEGPFDIIWCSMSLYFHDKGLPALIGRLADHLAPGGVLVSFHEALSDHRSAPPEHVLGRLIPALRQGDVSFADGEIVDAMAGAELVRPTSEHLSTPFGRFRLDAARKEA
ncbi:class I SAM-dependent methyltransferase [Paracoccus denitrificans]|uniref:class I SAM-dependent methyltransferase n=1 Tax=Paracoccus denitrificans TaxID=266 RepID=UPI001E5B41FE|nr:class I SAM-dependent methyltransferase [Paracoccus denitrificans]UFS67255.1 class I SAM-dependent methyltransferase [Paracoccus denitrificans]